MDDETIKSLNWDDLLATVLGMRGRTDKNSSLGIWKGGNNSSLAVKS